MKDTQLYELCAYFGEMIHFSREILKEFKKIYFDKEILEKYPWIKDAYLTTIIINLGKIFSDSKNETYRLEKFQMICSKNITRRLEDLKSNNSNLIKKITTNRKWIFAHTDKDFTKLGFSDERIDEVKRVFYGADISFKKATSKESERYYPVDLLKDLPQLETVLDELDQLWKDALDENYKKGLQKLK